MLKTKLRKWGTRAAIMMLAMVMAFTTVNFLAPTKAQAVQPTIGDKAIGDIVTLKIDGVDTEFIVVQQGDPYNNDPSFASGGSNASNRRYYYGGFPTEYDIAYNGGDSQLPRESENFKDLGDDYTWLLMKDVYSTTTFTNTNSGNGGDNNTWGDQKIYHTDLESFDALIDESLLQYIPFVRVPMVRSKVVNGRVYIDSGNGEPGHKPYNASTRSFLLSASEIGYGKVTAGASWSNTEYWEGATLSYFAPGSTSGWDASDNSTRVAEYNDSATQWWTRTMVQVYSGYNNGQRIHDRIFAYYINYDGTIVVPDTSNGAQHTNASNYNGYQRGLRPALMVKKTTPVSASGKVGVVEITYHNGVSTSTQEVHPGVATALNNVTSMFSTPSGYTFYGWADSGSTSTRTYTNQQSVTITSDTDLYAVYSRSITFKSGYNKAGTTNVTQYYYGGSAKTITAPASGTFPYSGVGWALDGWTTGTAANSSVAASPDASFTPSATTYYAIFSRTVTINYNANGASGTTDSSTGTQYYNSYNAISTPSIATHSNGFTAPSGGYSFYQWATSSTGTSGTAAGSNYSWTPAYNASPATTLYAVWKRSVSFYGTTGSITSTIQQYYRNTGAVAITSPASSTASPPATGVGWTFNGWVSGTQASAVIDAEGNTSFIPTATTYYARFSRAVSVSYNGNGATGTTANSSGVQYYSTINALSAAEITLRASGFTAPTGYSFNFWGEANNSASGTAPGSPLSWTPAATTASITKTVYAIWRAHTYTVRYNGVAQTGGSTAQSTHTYNEAKNLTTNGFVRTYTVTYNANYTGGVNTSDTAEYTFDGWALTPDGDVAYTDGQSVTNLTATDGATVDLYAKWTAHGVTLPTKSRTNYILLGWSTSSSAAAADSGMTANASYTPTASTQLYAVWVVDNGFVAISATPAVAEITFPNSATFTASVTKQNPNAVLDYQWQIYDGGIWKNVAGATGSSYTTPAELPISSYTYRCHVVSTVEGDSKAADTNTTALTVTKGNGANALLFSAPGFVANGTYVMALDNGALDMMTVTHPEDATLSVTSTHSGVNAALSAGELTLTPTADTGNSYATVTIQVGETENYNAGNLSFKVYVSDGPTVSATYSPNTPTVGDVVATISVTDPAAAAGAYDLPGYTLHTVSPTVTMDSTAGTQMSASTFRFTQNGNLTVTAADSLSSETMQLLTVSWIDHVAPTMAVMTIGVDPTTYGIQTYISAQDNISATADLLYCWDYDPDSGSNVWEPTPLKSFPAGTKLTVAVKDECENIASKPLHVKLENRGGGGTPSLIDNNSLSIDGYTIGATAFMTENDVLYSYPTHMVNGDDVTGIAVTFDAEPAAGGVLSGYAKLSTGEKFPVYWELPNGTYADHSDTGGTGIFFVTPNILTKSAKTARITLSIFEYEDNTLAKKTYEDSVSASVTVDLSGPAVNIYYDKVTKQVTINARDDLSGIATVEYSTDQNPAYTAYSDPFTKPDNVSIIYVRATDRLNNSTDKSSSALESTNSVSSGLGGVSGISGTAFDGAGTYRTTMFNYYIYNGK